MRVRWPEVDQKPPPADVSNFLYDTHDPDTMNHMGGYIALFKFILTIQKWRYRLLSDWRMEILIDTDKLTVDGWGFQNSHLVSWGSESPESSSE